MSSPEQPLAAGPPETPVGSAGETVLMVEDNPAVRSVVQRQLQQLGYRVLSADSAASALSVLNGAERIDLVFSDVVMPGMSGIELAGEVRRRWPHIKIVLTSGFPETILSGRIDASDYPILGKPYRRAELAKRLRQELDV